MKHLLVFIMFLCSASAYAQDVIVKKDGSTILSKVLEVGQIDIKYKRFENLDGPTYTIAKADLQAINYQNGAKDTFSAPVREENKYLTNNQNDGVQRLNDRALLELDHATNKSVKTLKTIGWIGGGVLLVATGLFASSGRQNSGGGKDWLVDEKSARKLALVCGGGAMVWTTSFLLAAYYKEKKLESQVLSTTLYKSDFFLSNGSSLSAGIDLLSDQFINNNTLGIGLRYNF